MPRVVRHRPARRARAAGRAGRRHDRGYGLASRIAGWCTLESAAAYARGAHDELDREIVAAARDLVERDGAETVVLSGAVMAGVPARLQKDLPVPLIDCLACAIGQAELLVRLGHPKATAGSYAAPLARELVNVEAAIAARFATAGRAP